MPKQIVICDDHLLFLNGISELLKNTGNNYGIAKFSDVHSCRQHLMQNEADVFICDLNINHFDGFLLLEELKFQLKNTKTIILTAYYEDFLIQKARKLGVNAFLKKETPAEELISVIESGLNKEFYTNKSYKKGVSVYSTIDEPIINKFRISRQEKEIIKLIIKGLTSKEIADVLFISITTVTTHRKNIHRKLEISNSSSLIKFAHENNLLH
ncbi:response regulator transcription factor [Pedobacter miscanthi]|jgi:DNA-binding NarL/FixJ family response regulator|uniref:response regulator transcription factor n=1 Tax=Pedobacter miscanthi TaxID=2259170 RepID=UPI00293030CC|nr:response regulator transcription factor [Pedobacter miscanthi]